MKMNINTIAQLSGIKPHTLRIWEKRYSILHPKRTDGGTRIYTDEDLKTILNIQALALYGYKISKAASLSSSERHKIIKEKLEEEQDTNQYSLFIDQMVISAIELDEINFEKSLNQSIIRWGFETTITSVIYPLLNKIGILWEIDNVSPIEEHFASQIVVQKINEATSLLPYPINSNKEFILFLPENNNHVIPLLFANYLLRKNKQKTIFLGEDVPLKNLYNIQGKVNVKNPVFVTFFIFRQEKESVKTIENLIQNTSDDINIWIGGESNNLQILEKTFKDNTRIRTFHSINDFRNMILNTNINNE